jgi:hypothetical protein
MMTAMSNWIAAILLGSATSVFLLSKCLFLAPCRAGGLMVLANLIYEVAERKLRCSRAWLDILLWPLLVLGFWLWAGPAVAALAALGLGLAWGWALHVDSDWKAGRLARQFQDLKGRVPLPIPQLIVTIRGPVLARGRRVDRLGDWPEGLEQAFEVLVLNPSPVCAQIPLGIHIVSSTDRIEVRGSGGGERPGPDPGETVCVRFSLRASRCGAGGDVQVHVQHGDFQSRRTLRIRSILARSKMTVRRAEICRWKYGASGAFVWRGDQDLYDPATFQSAEGLRVALGLARRFRMPSSLMLSARLSLVPEEHREFCAHFGWDRKTEEIPEFIRFLRDDVDKAAEQEWPTATDRPFAAEIGNHFYLHYGTHVAADAGNGWKSHARIGAGRYPWLSRHPADSFTEQRDNALKCNQVFRETLGFAPASFTIPGDVFDGDTARAVEAAGLEVGSETDASKSSKLWHLSAPHHPAGCSHFVELPRMHPRDPENANQLAMVKYWVGSARRTGRALVFLAHHHLMRYQGHASLHLVEELLRHVLADQQGDLYVGTLTAVGRYWRDVLSERTRCVLVTLEHNRITVTNSGPRALNALPLEISLSGGRQHLRLVSIPAYSSITLTAEVP